MAYQPSMQNNTVLVKTALNVVRLDGITNSSKALEAAFAIVYGAQCDDPKRFDLLLKRVNRQRAKWNF